MRYILLVFAMFFIMGCSNINKANYDKLQMGMPYTKVVEILGKADKCDSLTGMSDCTWGSEKSLSKLSLLLRKLYLCIHKG